MAIIYNIKSGKNTKAVYYMRCVCRRIIPSAFFRMRRESLISKAKKRHDFDYIMERVNYYNKLQFCTQPLSKGFQIRSLKKDGGSSYFYDTHEFTRWFDPDKIIATEWGDVTYIPDEPAIVKSRPISGDNKNSVVMKLDKIRHFLFVDDNRAWEEKCDRVIFRGKIPGKEKRERFFNMYFGDPLCDLGDTSRNGIVEWHTGKRTLDEHLQFKFILALEGNDVASNLKWVMSSASVAVMPRPEFETWFMEGRLIPDYHYIEIKPDFSDLHERIQYYLNRPDEAKKIIHNANEYVRQFRDNEREKIISVLTLDKYISLVNECENNKEAEK